MIVAYPQTSSRQNFRKVASEPLKTLMAQISKCCAGPRRDLAPPPRATPPSSAARTEHQRRSAPSGYMVVFQNLRCPVWWDVFQATRHPPGRCVRQDPARAVRQDLAIRRGPALTSSGLVTAPSIGRASVVPWCRVPPCVRPLVKC